jgi:hypothetical protein
MYFLLKRVEVTTTVAIVLVTIIIIKVIAFIHHLQYTAALLLLQLLLLLLEIMLLYLLLLLLLRLLRRRLSLLLLQLRFLQLLHLLLISTTTQYLLLSVRLRNGWVFIRVRWYFIYPLQIGEAKLFAIVIGGSAQGCNTFVDSWVVKYFNWLERRLLLSSGLAWDIRRGGRRRYCSILNRWDRCLPLLTGLTSGMLSTSSSIVISILSASVVIIDRHSSTSTICTDHSTFNCSKTDYHLNGSSPNDLLKFFVTRQRLINTWIAFPTGRSSFCQHLIDIHDDLACGERVEHLGVKLVKFTQVIVECFGHQGERGGVLRDLELERRKYVLNLELGWLEERELIQKW